MSDQIKYGKEPVKYYFWVGNKTGYTWSWNINTVPKPKKGERLKYLGWTTDTGWPKRMNTGRLLKKPSAASMKKLGNIKVI